MNEKELLAQISIQLPANSEVNFKTLAEFDLWIEKEQQAWNWLDVINNRQYGNIFASASSALRNLKNLLVEFQNNGTSPNVQIQIMEAVRTITNQIKYGQYIVSHSILGRMIISLSKDHVDLASLVFFVATKKPTENLPNTKEMGLAVAVLANHYIGISKKTAVAAISSLESSESDFNALLLGSKHKIQGIEEKFSQNLAVIEKKSKEVGQAVVLSIKRTRRRVSEERIEAASEFEKSRANMIDSNTKEISEFRDFLEKQIGLQVPASYWSSKKLKHMFGTCASGAIFLIYVVTLICLVKAHVSGAYGSIDLFFDHWKTADFGVFGLLAGTVALALMFARVLYRMFASQLHLWNDSAERVTMIQTYLALAEKGHAKEEFLGALMGRLFSPASDGVVRDDLGSIGPFDAATKWIGGRS